MRGQHMYYDGRFVDHDGWDVAAHIAWLLVVVAIVVVAAVVVLRFVRAAPALSAPTATGDDAAMAELRLRYARGEVSRDDFLTRLSDLTSAGADTGPAQAP